MEWKPAPFTKFVKSAAPEFPGAYRVSWGLSGYPAAVRFCRRIGALRCAASLTR